MTEATVISTRTSP